MKFLEQIRAITLSVHKDPKKLFDEIVGYDDIKKAFFLFINSQKKINILLNGPPGCSKTLFLLAMQHFKGAYFLDASNSSGAGIFDELIDEKGDPKFLLLDEIDGLKRSDQKTLFNMFETGILKSTKIRNKKETGHVTRSRELKNLKVFATCNDTSKLSNALLSRFMVLTLKEYTEQEFLDIAAGLYPKKDPLLVEYVAKATLHILKSKDIRDFQKIADQADSAEEADMLIQLQVKYAKPKEEEEQ